MTWRMRIACGISKATREQAHSRVHAPTQKYVIPIAFPRQQGFRERVSMLIIRSLPLLFLFL